MNTSTTPVNLREAIKNLDSLPALPFIAEKMLPSFGMDERVDAGIHDSDWEALSIAPANAEEILIQAAEQADQASQFAANLA